MKTAKDLYEKIDPALAAKLSRSGGLRGLFDPYSAEYSACSVPEKVQLLAAICRAGVDVEGAMGAAEEVMRRVGYESARPTITEGAIALLQCAALAVGSVESPVSELHFDGIMHVFALGDAGPDGVRSLCGLSIPVGAFCALPEDSYHDEPDVPVGDGLTYRVCGYCRTVWGERARA
jgi:hypothetical protein